MSARREFSRAVRRDALARAKGCCEDCGMVLKPGEAEIDHVLPNELGGEATLENARVLCRVCHRIKTAADIKRIRKGDRMRDKDSGAFKPSSRPMAGSKASGLRRKLDGTVERRT